MNRWISSPISSARWYQRLVSTSFFSTPLEPGNYLDDFIAGLNERLANYAECGFDENGPTYDFTRCLAQSVAGIMSISNDKWVVEQVMDIEAPELLERIRPVVRGVLGVGKK